MLFSKSDIKTKRMLICSNTEYYICIDYLAMMKIRLLSLVLASVLFLQSVGKVLYVVRYYAYQDYIEKTFCKNQNKPELDCKGKCHLMKQIEEEDKGEIPHQSRPPKMKEDIVFCCHQQTSTQPVSYSYDSVFSYYTEPLSDLAKQPIFQPPRFLPFA